MKISINNNRKHWIETQINNYFILSILKTFFNEKNLFILCNYINGILYIFFLERKEDKLYQITIFSEKKPKWQLEDLSIFPFSIKAKTNFNDKFIYTLTLDNKIKGFIIDLDENILIREIKRKVKDVNYDKDYIYLTNLDFRKNTLNKDDIYISMFLCFYSQLFQFIIEDTVLKSFELGKVYEHLISTNIEKANEYVKEIMNIFADTYPSELFNEKNPDLEILLKKQNFINIDDKIKRINKIIYKYYIEPLHLAEGGDS